MSDDLSVKFLKSVDSKEVDLYLPDDIIFYLWGFLNERDCIAFSISGVCKRFSTLYAERRRIVVSQCYFLTPELFSLFITNWICQDIITYFDISHCYWLPEISTLEVISSLPQLQVLYVQDTKLQLVHCAQIFISCPHIVNLGISIVEDDWEMVLFQLGDEHNSSSTTLYEALSKGLEKLTLLKMLVYSSSYYIDSWLVILPLLSLCGRCVDLHMEVSYTEDYFYYGPFGKDDYDEEIVHRVQTEYFPQLTWMLSLKCFVFIKRGFSTCNFYPDVCLDALIQWIFYKQQESGFKFERLWIQEPAIQDDVFEPVMIDSNVKSLLPGSLVNSNYEHERLRSLQHIGRVGITENLFLPNVRFIQGYCVDSQGLDTFCRAHPKLEHLLLNDNNGLPFTLQEDWILVKLKTLVYRCSIPVQSVLERFVNACPNLETLHIGYSNRSDLDPWYSTMNVDFLKSIQLNRLTTLSLNSFELFDGNFFETIITGCPELRNLHINRGISVANCFDNFCRSLPLARKLRDFRLVTGHCDEITFGYVLTSILHALSDCYELERLVLFAEDHQQRPEETGDIENILIQFVVRMRNLVAICFVGPDEFHPDTISHFNERFIHEVVPLRPSLWYYFGPTFPKENEPTVPRIHYDEIVCPINYFEMPPQF